jgi:aspartyl-tRNA(Asn)/glutamyl-tRNA(Gln) amidotransferase subunit A
VSDVAFMTIAEAGRLIKDKALSPVEYTRSLIDRMDGLDDDYNAFLLKTPDIALRQAQVAEAEIAKGDWRGPLHGVPFALKDIIDYKGLPTTCHSKILQDNIAENDATVTERLRAAGAVFLGKLSTHEFAIGGPSFDLPWPPARNPWNRAHFTGGSSSGSGAALAAGMVPAALGSDTGGSVRNPASMCGIVGMKATYGRVSRRGVFPLSYSLDHVGPMTRTVEDNAILLNILAGHDPLDPGSANVATSDYTARLRNGVEGLRIGVIRHFYTKDMVADSEMADGIEAAAATLATLGADVREATVAPLSDYAAANRVILLPEAYAIHEKWLRERPGDYGELARMRIMGGAFIRAADYVNAVRMRAKLTREFYAAIEDFDVVITASSMEPACEIEDRDANEFTYGRQARAAFNLTGSPALAIPTGFAQSGLPLSMQIIGKPFEEALIYQVAHAFEQASDWTNRRPPLPDA